MPFLEESKHILNNACIGVGLIPVAMQKGILHTVISREKQSPTPKYRLYGGLSGIEDFPPTQEEKLKAGYLIGLRELLEEAPQSPKIKETFTPQRIANAAQPVGTVYRELPKERLGDAKVLFTTTYVITCKMEELSLFTQGQKDGIEESPDHHPAIITPFSLKGKFTPQDPAKNVQLSENYALTFEGEYRALGIILNMYERGILYGITPPKKIVLKHLQNSFKERALTLRDIMKSVASTTQKK